MRTKGVNKAQQLEYIFECRNSGLSDYQWCKDVFCKPLLANGIGERIDEFIKSQESR